MLSPFIWATVQDIKREYYTYYKQPPSPYEQFEVLEYGPPFTLATYQAYLRKVDRFKDDYDQRFRDLRKTSSPNSEEWRSLNREEGLFDMIYDIEYSKRLPYLTFSRCPFCSTLIQKQFDPFDTSGTAWHIGPVPVNIDCPHIFVLQGALHLNGHAQPYIIPKISLYQIVQPGPEVPFVLPRLMQFPQMRLVISSLPIAEGRHTAYILTYFAEPRPPWVEASQDWCRSSYSTRGPEIYSWAIRNDAYDYDLEPYLARGQIYWINPFDETYTVQTSPANDCPYVNLPGKRERQRFVSGQVQYIGNPTGSPRFIDPW